MNRVGSQRHKKKANVYLSSLMIKVPDHVYVLGYTYTCHTLKNNMRHSGLLLFYLCSPTPSTTLSHTCAYVTRMKDNFSRSFYLCFPTPPTTHSHTCAYVTRMTGNFSRSFEPRYVTPDTRISSGQCPRCDVNVTLGSQDFQGHTK
jgi:hypothetical protein